LTSHQPLSDMKWYREAQIMNEKLGSGKIDDNYELKQHKRHVHVKQVLYPETDGIMPPRRPKNYDHITQLREKIERVSDILAGDEERERRDRMQEKERKEMEKDYLHRKIYRPESDDEELLAPIGNYLDECRAQEIIAEEKYGFEDPKCKTRAELRAGDEPFEWRRVQIPDKNLAGKTLTELNDRRDSLRKRTKRVEGTRTDDGFVVSKEEEMLRVARPGIWAYEDGPKHSQVKGHAWRELERKYKPIEEDDEPEQKKKATFKNPYLDSESDDELYGVAKPLTRMERYDRAYKEPSPERDYVTRARHSRRRDPDYDELDTQVKKLRKIRTGRSPSLSPERFTPTRGEFQGDLSQGMTFSAKRTKAMRQSTADEIYTSQPAPCVSYKPEFQLRLRKKVIPAGLSAKFTCSIRGRPDPEISWMKQESGIILENGVKYNMTSLAGVASLTINNCEERDMGTYRCTARNAAGETSDYAQLEVTGSNFTARDNKLQDSKFDATNYELDFWTRQRAHDQWHTKTPSETGSYSSQRNTINMPYFIRKPEDMELTEGESIVVYASCDAKPPAKVTWTKEGSAVQDSGRVRIRSKGNQYRLEIDSIKFTDAGMYKVYAENCNGKAVSAFRVDVNVRKRVQSDSMSITSRGSRGSRKGASSGPRIMQALQGQVRLDGTFRMECSVLDASSVREAVWYKDDLRVSDYTDRISLSERAGIYSLNIVDMQLKDAGSYACNLAGISGGFTTSQFSITRDQIQAHMNTIAKLKRTDKSSAGGTSLPRSVGSSRHSATEFGQQMEQGVSMESVMTSSSGRDSAPQLEPLPSDVDCALGRALVLTTSWKGQAGKVQWFVNGMEAEEDDRVRIDTVGCTSTLSILNTLPDDAGLYRITVRNDNGSDSSEVVATIH
jgi:hypothetical protein